MGSESASSLSDKRHGRPGDESAIEFLRDFPALLVPDGGCDYNPTQAATGWVAVVLVLLGVVRRPAALPPR